jgi:hypothetical protein
MDIFAHVAWTNIVFYKKLKAERINRFIAMLFGVLPDFVSFAPVFVYQFFARKNFMELVGSNVWMMRFAEESYKYTHSFVIFVAIVLVLYFLRSKSWYWPIWGWGLHILIDIPTHRGFYETPFLFPISGYQFSHGISWAHPTFMIINYGALALIYLVWFVVFRKQKQVMI